MIMVPRPARVNPTAIRLLSEAFGPRSAPPCTPWRSIEQPRHFLDAQHRRQLARLVNDMGVLDDRLAPERDPEEEPQGRYGLVDGRHADTACRQMQLVATHVLETRSIRRSPEKRSEVLDPLHIVML